MVSVNFGPFGGYCGDYLQPAGKDVHGVELFNPLWWDDSAYELWKECTEDHANPDWHTNEYCVNDELATEICASFAEEIAMTGALPSELIPR